MSRLTRSADRRCAHVRIRSTPITLHTSGCVSTKVRVDMLSSHLTSARRGDPRPQLAVRVAPRAPWFLENGCASSCHASSLAPAAAIGRLERTGVQPVRPGPASASSVRSKTLPCFSKRWHAPDPARERNQPRAIGHLVRPQRECHDRPAVGDDSSLARFGDPRTTIKRHCHYPSW